MMKSSNELTITVSGKSGTGKSNLAAHLTRLLSESGFDINFQDEDTKETTIGNLGNEYVLKYMKECTNIKVTTQQLPR